MKPGLPVTLPPCMFQFDIHRAAQGQRCRGRLIFYLVHTPERDLNSGGKKKKSRSDSKRVCLQRFTKMKEEAENGGRIRARGILGI